MTVATAIEATPAVSSLMGNLAPLAQTIAVGAALVLIAYLIWRQTRGAE